MKCSRDQLSTLLTEASVLRFERGQCIAYVRFIHHSELQIKFTNSKIDET